MEYLIIQKLLFNKLNNLEKLEDNFFSILSQLAKDFENPLFSRITDPSNTNNVLSDLLSVQEKNIIISKAKKSIQEKYWSGIVF